MPNIARAFDILAGQAGRVLERDILMKKQRQEMIDKLLTEQAHRSYLKRLELDREEAFKTKLQKITGEQADKRSQFAAEQAWQRTEAEIKSREKVAEMRLQAAKAGKTGTERTYVDPYVSDMMESSDANYRALLAIKSKTDQLGRPIFSKLPIDFQANVEGQAAYFKAIRDEMIKKYYKSMGLKVPEIKKEPPPEYNPEDFKLKTWEDYKE